MSQDIINAIIRIKAELLPIRPCRINDNNNSVNDFLIPENAI